jgi:hypothetical protein
VAPVVRAKAKPPVRQPFRQKPSIKDLSVTGIDADSKKASLPRPVELPSVRALPLWGSKEGGEGGGIGGGNGRRDVRLGLLKGEKADEWSVFGSYNAKTVSKGPLGLTNEWRLSLYPELWGQPLTGSWTSTANLGLLGKGSPLNLQFGVTKEFATTPEGTNWSKRFEGGLQWKPSPNFELGIGLRVEEGKTSGKFDLDWRFGDSGQLKLQFGDPEKPFQFFLKKDLD